MGGTGSSSNDKLGARLRRGAHTTASASRHSLAACCRYLVLNMQEKMSDLGGCLMLETAVDKVLKASR